MSGGGFCDPNIFHIFIRSDKGFNESFTRGSAKNVCCPIFWRRCAIRRNIMPFKKFLTGLAIFSVIFLCAAPLFAADAIKTPATSTESALMDKSLEDLLSTPVAMIAQSSKSSYTPAAVTTITAEQIEMTPARNIYDLMEVYVPGATWVTHAESPHVGIRGIMSDRNYKMIVRVNGRELNQNGHSGGIAELEQWDLHDIEKIEIIRGPGSVTYGPGAIEGVINITTKNAKVSKGTKAGVQYTTVYNSTGAYFSEGIVENNYDAYFYGSLVATPGEKSPKEYYVTTQNHAGYMGRDSSLGSLRPLDYFNDANGLPQGKLYAELNIKEEIKAWVRYSNFGTSEHGMPINYQVFNSEGDQINMKQNQDRVLVGTIEDHHKFTEDLHLDSMVSLSSMDHKRWDNPALSVGNTAADTGKENSMRNIIQAFSETQLLLKTLLNYTFLEKYKLAAGIEYSHEQFGPGWGDSKEQFRMGDSSNILGSSYSTANNSNATQNAVAVTNPLITTGWGDNTVSYLAEANLEFHRLFNLILSGRMDTNTYTRPMFSPRIAVINDFGPWGVAKWIAQQSTRMNTAEALYLTDERNGKNNPETLNGVEFIYDVSPLKRLFLETSLYYNHLNAIGWSSASMNSTNIGKQSIGGFEIEEKYKVTDKLSLGASQSLAKQIDFKLADGQTRSGLSYADYNTTAGGLHYTGTGNDLNNWPNWSAKFYSDYKVTPKWTLHGNMQLFWDYAGNLDGLQMIEDAARGTANQGAIDSAISDMRAQHAYKINGRINAAIRYKPNKNFTFTAMALNLIPINGSKRYSYDTGVNNAAPNRVTWIEEPITFAFKIDYGF